MNLNETIGEDDCRKLTEFLGECWHELKEPNGSIEELNFGGTVRCKHCGEIQQAQLPFQVIPARLDFSDWRVVGRLIEKMKHVGLYKVGTMWLVEVTGDDYGAPTPQEAVCRACLAFIEEEK